MKNQNRSLKLLIQKTKFPDELSKVIAKEFRGTIITVLKVDEQGSTFLNINIDGYCEWLPRPEVVRDIKIFIRGFNAAIEIEE